MYCFREKRPRDSAKLCLVSHMLVVISKELMGPSNFSANLNVQGLVNGLQLLKMPSRQMTVFFLYVKLSSRI